MEVTTLLLVGWAIFCVFLVLMGKYVSQRFLQPKVEADAEPILAPAAPSKPKLKADGPSAPAQSTPIPIPRPTSVAAAKVGVGGGGGGGGATVVRRRNSSQVKESPSISPVGGSSIPPLLKSSPLTPPVPAPKTPAVELREVANLPFATGTEKDAVAWVNSLLEWIYTDPTPTPDIQETWIRELNKVAAKLASENGIQMAFQEITSDSDLPILTNVMADPSPDENIVNILCDIQSTYLGFVLHVTRQMKEDYWATEYACSVDALSGPISVACDPKTLVGTAHFDCRPKIKLTLVPNPRTKLKDPVDEQALQQVVSEIVTGAIAHSTVDLCMAQFELCPRYVKSKVIIDPVLPVHYDSMTSAQNTAPPARKLVKKGRRLLVKVVKANNLGSDKGCSSPYCIVELDEPAQKHTTAITDGESPFWDEHFLFDLNNETGEILFEVWDQFEEGKGDRFLGLGIVSVDDLLRNPSQRQIITLQSRPYEGDDVTGSLTVEFACMESAEVPRVDSVRRPVQPMPAPTPVPAPTPPSSPTRTQSFTSSPTHSEPPSSPTRMVPPSPRSTEKPKPPRPPPPSPIRVETNRTVSPAGNVVTTTTTTIRKPAQGPPELNNKIEIERNSTDATPAEEDIEAEVKEVKEDEIVVNGEDTVTSTALRELARPKPDRPPAITTDRSTLIIHSVQRQPDGTETVRMPYNDSTTSLENPDDRSRPKERKSFMNTLRKRLSFRGKRSRSVDQHDPDSRDSSGSRSASVDRAHSMPGSREGSYPSSGSRAENLSAHSSLSEMSAASGASNQTYIDEASMLVIECLENGIVKHYLVPSSLANKSKWRKRGVKLHIYNDHTFIAKHLPSNSICQVCNKPFIRRIGKQGYECRDCLLTCHKPCHVRTDTHCPSSRVGSMELDYVHEGKGDRSK